jgi:hypothetical protein
MERVRCRWNRCGVVQTMSNNIPASLAHIIRSDGLIGFQIDSRVYAYTTSDSTAAPLVAKREIGFPAARTTRVPGGLETRCAFDRR